MSKEILFWSITEDAGIIADPPVPASTTVPAWYKKLGKFMGSDRFILRNGRSNTGLKKCVPFLDATISGYTVKLHCDLMVERIDNELILNWSSAISPVSLRDLVYASQLPEVKGYGLFTQAWEMPYGFKVPKGYSVLVTQPMNQLNLPTFITSGIIDADSILGPGGIPFAIAKDFEGKIPEGTPIIHLFPFKREEWKSKRIPAPVVAFANFKARNKFYGWYKENIWKRKNYV